LLDLGGRKLHPFPRKAHEPYFRSKNPIGWRHDLGAQDVFLDNFGLLVAEQFSDPELNRHFGRRETPARLVGAGGSSGDPPRTVVGRVPQYRPADSECR